MKIFLDGKLLNSGLVLSRKQNLSSRRVARNGVRISAKLLWSICECGTVAALSVTEDRCLPEVIVMWQLEKRRAIFSFGWCDIKSILWEHQKKIFSTHWKEISWHYIQMKVYVKYPSKMYFVSWFILSLSWKRWMKCEKVIFGWEFQRPNIQTL